MAFFYQLKWRCQSDSCALHNNTHNTHATTWNYAGEFARCLATRSDEADGNGLIAARRGVGNGANNSNRGPAIYTAELR